MVTPDEAFEAITRTLTERGIRMQAPAVIKLREVFDNSLGSFIALVMKGETRIDVWTDSRCVMFQRYVTETVTFAIADEARQMAKDPNFPSSPLDADTIECAAIKVMRRQSIRDTCTYHLDYFREKLGIVVEDRTKVCGIYFSGDPRPDCA